MMIPPILPPSSSSNSTAIEDPFEVMWIRGPSGTPKVPPPRDPSPISDYDGVLLSSPSSARSHISVRTTSPAFGSKVMPQRSFERSSTLYQSLSMGRPLSMGVLDGRDTDRKSSVYPGSFRFSTDSPSGPTVQSPLSTAPELSPAPTDVTPTPPIFMEGPEEVRSESPISRLSTPHSLLARRFSPVQLSEVVSPSPSSPMEDKRSVTPQSITSPVTCSPTVTPIPLPVRFLPSPPAQFAPPRPVQFVPSPPVQFTPSPPLQFIPHPPRRRARIQSPPTVILPNRPYSYPSPSPRSSIRSLPSEPRSSPLFIPSTLSPPRPSQKSTSQFIPMPLPSNPPLPFMPTVRPSQTPYTSYQHFPSNPNPPNQLHSWGSPAWGAFPGLSPWGDPTMHNPVFMRTPSPVSGLNNNIPFRRHPPSSPSRGFAQTSLGPPPPSSWAWTPAQPPFIPQIPGDENTSTNTNAAFPPGFVPDPPQGRTPSPFIPPPPGAQKLSAAATNKRHERFYFSDGSFIIGVKGTLYNIHEHIVQQHAPSLWTPPAYRPRITQLYDIEPHQFELVLSLLYPKSLLEHEPKSTSDWSSVLHVSHTCNMPQIRTLAISQLALLLAASPASKIELANKYNVREWFFDAYLELALSMEGLSVEDANKVGVEGAMMVADMKEMVAKGVRRFVDGNGNGSGSVPVHGRNWAA